MNTSNRKSGVALLITLVLAVAGGLTEDFMLRNLLLGISVISMAMTFRYISDSGMEENL